MNKLSAKRQIVADYIKSHPGCTKEDVCEKIYEVVNLFTLQNLDNLLSGLRKNGYLFYTPDNKGELVDLADPEVEVSKKMKVDLRIGNGMLGFVKAKVRITAVATDPLQIEASRQQLHEVDKLLAEARTYFYENSRNTNLKVKAGQESAKKVLVTRKN